MNTRWFMVHLMLEKFISKSQSGIHQIFIVVLRILMNKPRHFHWITHQEKE
jgi:hypothetical protein